MPVSPYLPILWGVLVDLAGPAVEAHEHGCATTGVRTVVAVGITECVLVAFVQATL